MQARKKLVRIARHKPNNKQLLLRDLNQCGALTRFISQHGVFTGSPIPVVRTPPFLSALFFFP